jgi:hypothetical protein
VRETLAPSLRPQGRSLHAPPEPCRNTAKVRTHGLEFLGCSLFWIVISRTVTRHLRLARHRWLLMVVARPFKTREETCATAASVASSQRPEIFTTPGINETQSVVYHNAAWQAAVGKHGRRSRSILPVVFGRHAAPFAASRCQRSAKAPTGPRDAAFSRCSAISAAPGRTWANVSGLRPPTFRPSFSCALVAS